VWKSGSCGTLPLAVWEITFPVTSEHLEEGYQHKNSANSRERKRQSRLQKKKKKTNQQLPKGCICLKRNKKTKGLQRAFPK